MTDTVRVTVTPGAPKGKNVGATIAGKNVNPKTGDITLDRNKDYDVVFTLAPANGVDEWDASTPFDCSGAGAKCPTKGSGPRAPFSQGPKGPKSMTVHVAAQSAPSKTEYRLNYNDSFTTDPIIIIN